MSKISNKKEEEITNALSSSPDDGSLEPKRYSLDFVSQ